MTLHTSLNQQALVPPPAPILLDVTRLVASRWKRKSATGLDRVALAYAEHYRSVALAVVQFRNLTRVLDRAGSRRLFDLLLDGKRPFRRAFTVLAAQEMTRTGRDNVPPGALYLNVGHTEFDLPEHVAWVKETGVKPVYFLHDLIPIRRPDLCRPSAVARHKARVDSALANGAAILVNSSATAADLSQYAGRAGNTTPPIQISALAGGDVQTSGAARTIDEVPYFLAVGTHEPRRDFASLVKVWERLVARSGKAWPKLKIVGQPWKHHPESYRSLERSVLRPHHLELVEQCSDSQLGDLMAGARALLMPTLAEGFGLPLVEAFALGTPVIASDLPSLRETGKGIPLLLEPGNPVIWEQAIFDFEQAPTERNRQIELLKTYRRPSWQDHFARIDPFLNTLSSSLHENLDREEIQCLIA